MIDMLAFYFTPCIMRDRSPRGKHDAGSVEFKAR